MKLLEMGIINFWIIISGAYVVLAILSPLFEHYRIPLFHTFYLFLRTSCHQIPDRCFWVWGSNMGLCTKCLGLYTSQPLILFLISPLKRLNSSAVTIPLSLTVFFLMVADSTFLKFSNSNITRLILGFLGGIGFASILAHIYLKWGGAMDKFWKTWKVLIIGTTCLLYLASMINIASAEENYVTVRGGTPVVVEVINTIDSEHVSQGQTVHMVVSRGVTADGQVVILPNTEVYARVSEVKKARGWGGKGSLSVILESTYAVDGQEIMISATRFTEGSGHRGSATAVGVATGLLCLPAALTGFAVKGEEGKIPAGTTIKARLDADYRVAVLSEKEIDRKMKEASERLKEIRNQIEEERLKAEQEKKEKEQRMKDSGVEPWRRQ